MSCLCYLSVFFLGPLIQQLFLGNLGLVDVLNLKMIEMSDLEEGIYATMRRKEFFHFSDSIDKLN